MRRRTFLGSAAAAGLAAVSGLPVPLANSPSDQQPLKLSSNENHLGLSPLARKAVEGGISSAFRYPFDVADELVSQLAEFHRIPPESILLGNGSGEILQMAMQAFANRIAPPLTALVMADPTFEAMPRYAEPFFVDIQKIPLAPDFSHDLEAMKETSRQAPSMIYICNPNNPTGTLTPSGEIERWLDQDPHSVFLIDEAYFHYVEDSSYYSFIQQASERQNLIVARTFSKVYAMAGMRLGYSVSHSELRDKMAAYLSDANTNRLALYAGGASLKDDAFLRRSRNANQAAKRILLEKLDALGIEHLPSHTNFVMFKLKGEIEPFRERMKEAGILVGRPFPPMTGYCRVSLGLPNEMEHFVGVLEDFRDREFI